MNAHAWVSLSAALKTDHFSQLTDLCLDDSELSSSTACDHLAPALLSLASLRSLSLCHCELQAAGALAITIACANLPSFCTLHVDGNAVNDVVVARIQSMLQVAGKTPLKGTDYDRFFSFSMFLIIWLSSFRNGRKRRRWGG